MNKALVFSCFCLLFYVGWREKTTLLELKDVVAARLDRSTPTAQEIVKSDSAPKQPNSASPPPVSATPTTPKPPSAAEPLPILIQQPDQLEAAKKNHFKHLVTIEGDQSRGSGFIAMHLAKPLLFTNTHVLGGNNKIAAKLLNGRSLTLQETFAVAESYDVSVFQQNTTTEALEILKDVESNISIGDEVYVLGNSLGAGVATEIQGQVTGIGPDLVEVDAKFVSGNSGSPIIHTKTGKVIGIATFSLVHKMEGFGRDSKFNSVERRFGYRLDNIPAWHNTSWQAFKAESAILNKITTRTDDVWNLAVDLASNGRVTNWNQHLRRDNYLALTAGIWQKALASLASSRTRGSGAQGGLLSEKKRFLNGALSAITIDVSSLKPEAFTAYHRKEFEEQMRYRDLLKDYFTFLVQELSNDPQFLTR